MSIWKNDHVADISQYGSADAAWDGPSGDPPQPTSSMLEIPPIDSANYKCRNDVSVQTPLTHSPTPTANISHPQPPTAPSPSTLSLSGLPAALILEIFSHFEARDLCVVACVSTHFRHLSAESARWKDFYCQRWLPPLFPTREGVAQPLLNWRDLYLKKEDRSRAVMGRYITDSLHGHTAGIRCTRIVPSSNLAVTAGYDSTVRIWNLDHGLPLASSPPLGSTVRSMAVNPSLLAVGTSDAAIRIWRPVPPCPHLFDVGASWAPPPAPARPGGGGGAGGWVGGMDATLYGHSGPVSCLALDGGRLYSGSWDMAVKVWGGGERCQLALRHSFAHSDWVWGVAPRGARLYSTAGSHLYGWDAEVGKLVWVREGVHAGGAKAVEASRNGQFVFTGGGDGVVRMFDGRVGAGVGGGGRGGRGGGEEGGGGGMELPFGIST